MVTSMAFDGFKPLDRRQTALCLACGVDHPEGMAVIRETEDYLKMRHHASYTEVTIHKSNAQKRAEREMKLW